MSVRVYPPVVGASGAGGGGGSNKGAPPGLEIKQLWTGNLTSITANQWVAIGTTPVPSDAIWLIWNGGAFSSGTDDGPAALSSWINAAKWRLRSPDTVGSTPSDNTGADLVDWGSTNIGDGTPDFARRDAVIGRTSANIPLILSTNANEAFHDAELSYVVATARVDATPSDLPEGAGYVIDVTEQHGGSPPTASEDNAEHLYYNRDIGKLWVPHRDPAPDTPASATTTTIAAETTGFRGILTANPSVNINGDWYYNRSGHSWRYRAEGDRLRNISFSELKLVAEQGGSLFFGADDVWLNEVDRLSVAVGILENLGTYDSAKSYYFVIGDVFYKIDTFTAAVNHRFNHDYIRLGGPQNFPTAIWYLNNQTSRFPTTFPYTTDPSSSRLRLRWSGDTPNEAPFGWNEPDIWVPGTDVNTSDIDTSASPGVLTNNVVFRPNRGTWDLGVNLTIDKELMANEEFALMLYRVKSGDDQVLRVQSRGQINPPGNFGGENVTPVSLGLEDYTTDGTVWLYFLVFTAANVDWRGEFVVRRKL